MYKRILFTGLALVLLSGVAQAQDTATPTQTPTNTATRTFTKTSTPTRTITMTMTAVPATSTPTPLGQSNRSDFSFLGLLNLINGVQTPVANDGKCSLWIKDAEIFTLCPGGTPVAH